MRLRKSSAFIAFTVINVTGLALLFAHGALERQRQAPVLSEKKIMVERFGLTDLCLSPMPDTRETPLWPTGARPSRTTPCRWTTSRPGRSCLRRLT